MPINNRFKTVQRSRVPNLQTEGLLSDKVFLKNVFKKSFVMKNG